MHSNMLQLVVDIGVVLGFLCILGLGFYVLCFLRYFLFFEFGFVF